MHVNDVATLDVQNTVPPDDLTREGIEPNPGWECKGCKRENNFNSKRPPDGWDSNAKKWTACVHCHLQRDSKSIRHSLVLLGIEPALTRAEIQEAHNARVLEATGKTEIRVRRDRVKAFRAELRIALGNPNTGLCAECNVEPPTEIDHLDPSLKRKSFGKLINSISAVIAEIEQNTVDGVVLLRGVCKGCHDKRTFTNVGKTVYVQSDERRTRIALVHERKIALAHCADPECSNPTFICQAGVEFMFHFDHLHPTNCATSGVGCKSGEGCTVNPSLRKVDFIPFMAQNTIQYTRDQLVDEMNALKVRLMHGTCHAKRTLEQHQAGLLRAQPTEAAAAARSEKVAINLQRYAGSKLTAYKPSAASAASNERVANVISLIKKRKREQTPETDEDHISVINAHMDTSAAAADARK